MYFQWKFSMKSLEWTAITQYISENFLIYTKNESFKMQFLKLKKKLKNVFFMEIFDFITTKSAEQTRKNRQRTSNEPARLHFKSKII